MRTFSTIRRQAAVLAGALLISSFAGAGVATADVPVNETDTWSGVFPFFGQKSLDIAIAIAIALPSPIKVNTESSSFAVTLTITGPKLRAVFTDSGARTVEGAGELAFIITDSASKEAWAFMEFTIPKQNVPAVGPPSLTLTAVGDITVPGIATAGTATVIVNPLIPVHLHPKKADGSDTIFGEFDMDIELNADEDPALGTIEVR